MVKALETTRSLLFYALIISFGNILFNIHQDYLRIQERLKSYGIWSITNVLLNFVLTLTFVILFKQGWLGRIDAQLIGMLILGLLAVVSFGIANSSASISPGSAINRYSFSVYQ